ncbi:hypothetical protein RO3G_13704 [Rhizopus delemar RA 99-880]|uniref:Uncharacterized protein n=1 Tax=Rhizopus delemar (strain RA 99-880 / ATCC MYA-4621 / FGSC 9543 / NRRL 43880) TaxID=246409 RepID=I1CKL3_RHIO9|nr:hypothetical protein RO3G_13704 [Rhizopus delemar RA 99-880]|eukprot:EIE88993.1 hypothetical protein RO3G_13704 [Rhizopus delemar RA 99-880]
MTAPDYIHILKTELADTLAYYRLGDVCRLEFKL